MTTGPRRGKRFRRTRRLVRRPAVRVILALVTMACCWLAFSVGQALTAPGGVSPRRSLLTGLSGFHVLKTASAC